MNLLFVKIIDKVIDMRVLSLCLLFLLFSCSMIDKSIQDTELDKDSAETAEEKIDGSGEDRINEKAEVKAEKIEEITANAAVEIKTENIVVSTAIINSRSSEAAEDSVSLRLVKALAASKLPRNISDRITENISQSGNFFNSLNKILLFDPYLRFLVDKEHPLGANYEPDDLVQLKNGLYSLNNHEVLMLRISAVSSLEEMAAAAKRDGITLVVSYAYRSYARQNQSYSMHVRNMGQKEADRVSARPGYSQHQLGTTIDFGSVSNDFAGTAQGIWLLKNASKFGWSLSYPNGYEAVTGYNWESWHYRYVGKELAEFIDKYFNGIQQYALRFLHEYGN